MFANIFKRNNDEVPDDDFVMKATAHEERINNISKELEGLLSDILRLQNPYSETLQITADGKFGPHALYTVTPEEFYGKNSQEFQQIALEVEKKHPEYHFTFETDPEGKWIKYSVSKK